MVNTTPSASLPRRPRISKSVLATGALLLAWSVPAQTPAPAPAPSPAASIVATQTPPVAAEQTSPATNAAFGGGGRFRRNTLTFPPDETNRLVRLGNRGVPVHDPSTIVKSADEFWMFYTGPGVPSYHSKDLVQWERGPITFTNLPAWITNVPGFRGRSFWAPDVIHLGDRYLLYYSASSFGKNTSAIGLAINRSLDPQKPEYGWVDQGIVVQSKASDDFNTIDPAVTLDADGGLWLAFGSFWSGIKLIQLDPKTGLRIAPDSPMYSLAHYSSIEAAFIYHHGRHYYLFVNWGFCCRGASSTYEIRVGRSDKITGPYLDRDGKDLLVGGGTKVLETDGAFIGPGHAGILAEGNQYWFGCHFYDGTTQRGTSKYAIRPMHWDAGGWPVVEPPAK